MRKMQEFIVKGKRIFVGLEDSKKTWKLCVRCEGMVVQETSMPAKYDILRAYLVGRYPECIVKVMYEAGFQGFWLHDLLEEDGIDCVVTPPNKVTVEKDDRVKTDKRDARRLSKNLENGDYASCTVPDRERREDRQISRTLDQVQKNIRREKNRIRKLLDFHGLNEGLREGAWTDRDYRQLRGMNLPRSLKVSLDAYLGMLDELFAVEKELKKEMKALCAKERYQVCVDAKDSCPGVGWLTAIRLTLEWGDMRRFATGKHIASFTGLTASEYSSGKTLHRGRITAQSSDTVRSWLIECAWRAIRKDPALLNKFQRVWTHSGSKKKAIVAVARKLAVRMRALETGQHHEYCIGVIE
jgi:transposase